MTTIPSMIFDLFTLYVEENLRKRELDELMADKLRIEGKIELATQRLDSKSSEIKPLRGEMSRKAKELLRTTGSTPWSSERRDDSHDHFIYVEGCYAFMFGTAGGQFPQKFILEPTCACCGGLPDDDEGDKSVAEILKEYGITHFVATGVSDHLTRSDIKTLVWDKTDIRPVKAMEAFPELFSKSLPVHK